MRAFLDTNVLIDLLTERPPEGVEAVKLLAMQELGDVELWASAKSFTDMFCVMRKENPSEVVQQAFIDSLEYLQVCELGCEDIRAAAERKWIDFEDCLIDVCAEKIRADVLLTRDKDGFKQSRLKTASPKQMFLWLEEEMRLTYEVIDWPAY